MKLKKNDRPLLTRGVFRELVFKRDHYRCIICGEPAADAHHIMERRLWPDGGYYLNNGASVCPQHHWDCEKGIISPAELRKRLGIERILPPQLDPTKEYDKWGEEIE